MVAPFSASGRGDGDGGAFEGPANQRRLAPRAPLAEQDTVALRQAAQEAAPEQARPAVQIGLGAPPPVAAPEMPEAGERHLAPEHGEQRDGRARHDDRHQPHPVESFQPGQDGAERTGILQGPHDAGPEGASGDRERPAVEPEAEPEGRVLAVGRHVGEERRPEAEAESDGGRVLRPVSGDQPRRPGAGGGEKNEAQAQLDRSHRMSTSLLFTGCIAAAPPQLPAPPRRTRAPMRTAPRREMPPTAAPPVRSLPSSPAPARPPIQSRTAEGSRSISLKEAFISP